MRERSVNYRQLFSAILQLLLFMGYLFSCIMILPMEATDRFLYLNVFCLCISMNVGLVQDVIALFEMGKSSHELFWGKISVCVLTIASLFIMVMVLSNNMIVHYPDFCRAFARLLAIVVTVRQAVTALCSFMGAFGEGPAG